MIKRLPIIGVMGSGSDGHKERCQPLGRWIAQSGYHLLTGGGNGVMLEVSKAFCETDNRHGMCIGIIPGEMVDGVHKSFSGYPNPYVEIPVYTHLPLSGKDGTNLLSRNHINILSSDLIIALPGSYGTASEIELALQYGKTVIGFMDSVNAVEGLSATITLYNDFKKLTIKLEEYL